jgi:hypothetical protein
MRWKVADFYQSVAKKWPLTLSSIAGFVTACIGDVYCQVMVDKCQWNARRTTEMGVIRATVVAPLLHLYFPWLLRTFPGTGNFQVLKRVVADQCIGSPSNIVIVFITSGLLKGQSEEFILQRIKEQSLPTWQRGITFWPFVHMLNFRFVPVMHQPVVSHTASICWQVILSNRTNMPLASRDHPPAPAPVTSPVAAAAQ